ncbi:MAG: protein TolR [Henriciella sp.]|nr:protein TolR [Henriciella sp.]
MGMMTSGSGGSSRGRRSMNAEINVTPLVDVMLVLLIVFMITAPLLTTGVDVTLPQTASQNLPAPSEAPLSVTVDEEGKIYVQETEIEIEALTSQLIAITNEGYEERIFLRGDQNVDYGRVMEVMTQMQRAGFRNIAMVTDPKSTVQGAQ